jgi:hypothetical protein
MWQKHFPSEQQQLVHASDRVEIEALATIQMLVLHLAFFWNKLYPA